MESIFSPLLICILVFVGFFVTVAGHELGHAIPALFAMRGGVTIYIGSFGSGDRCFRFSLGRVEFFCKYNPLLWYRGCCMVDAYSLSLNEQIFYTAGGPIASLLITFLTWSLITVTQHVDVLRIVFGFVFVISLMSTFSSLLPIWKVRYTPSGRPVYHDAYQLIRLIRLKMQ